MHDKYISTVADRALLRLAPTSPTTPRTAHTTVRSSAERLLRPARPGARPLHSQAIRKPPRIQGDVNPSSSISYANHPAFQEYPDDTRLPARKSARAGECDRANTRPPRGWCAFGDTVPRVSLVRSTRTASVLEIVRDSLKDIIDFGSHVAALAAQAPSHRYATLNKVVPDTASPSRLAFNTAAPSLRVACNLGAMSASEDEHQAQARPCRTEPEILRSLGTGCIHLGDRNPLPHQGSS